MGPPYPTGTVARYSCALGRSFRGWQGARGGFQARVCQSGAWEGTVAACDPVQPADTWVIAPPATACLQACEDQGVGSSTGLGCSTPDTRAVNFSQAMGTGATAAMPYLTCAKALSSEPAAVAPAFDYGQDACAQEGPSSTCSAVPGNSTVQRLCYCRPKCPPVPPPPLGATVAFVYEGAVLQCHNGPCPSGTQARYGCSPGFAFSNELGVRGGFQTKTCVSGTWTGEVATCLEQAPANAWVIAPPAYSCEGACQDQGMACSLPDTQLVTNVTAVVGSAIPGLTCQGALTIQAGIAPALDVDANACAQSGSGSVCDAFPPINTPVQRLCYCRPKCPPPPPLGPNTEVQFLYMGQERDCMNGMCPSWTQARYRCTNGKVFSNQQSLRGGWQTTTCVSGTWRGRVGACVEPQLVNSWVISPTATACGDACSSYSLSCSAPRLQSMTTPAQLAKVVGSAVPWLTCTHAGDADSQDAFEPALDLTTSKCYATGQASSCDATPAGDVRRLW